MKNFIKIISMSFVLLLAMSITSCTSGEQKKNYKVSDSLMSHRANFDCDVSTRLEKSLIAEQITQPQSVNGVGEMENEDVEYITAILRYAQLYDKFCSIKDEAMAYGQSFVGKNVDDVMAKKYGLTEEDRNVNGTLKASAATKIAKKTEIRLQEEYNKELENRRNELKRFKKKS